MATKSIRWAFNFTKWNPTEYEMQLATACIQSEEKARLARFVFKKDFKASLIGRLLMRKFVHEATHFSYNEINFSRDDKGKPILQIPQSVKLAFNVSHQGNYVVLAGEIGVTSLGIDVMKMEYSGGKTISEFFRIMYRQFSNQEWVEIKGFQSENEQIAMFCRHWCLKESYVKAIGVGITTNLQEISFKTNNQLLQQDSIVADSELFIKNERENWTFEETLIDNEHCVAVALRNNESVFNCETSKFSRLEFSEIMRNAIPLLPYDENYCEMFFKKPDAP